MFLSDEDKRLINDALPAGWVQTARNVWQRCDGYMGAPMAQLTDTAVGLVCDSFIMQPHRTFLLPPLDISSRAAMLDGVEAAMDKLQAAERGRPNAPRWMPVQSPRLISNELGPDFPNVQYFPTARGLKAATVVAGHVIVVVEVFGAVGQSMFSVAIDNHPLTTDDGQLRLFDTAPEAATAAKKELA